MVALQRSDRSKATMLHPEPRTNGRQRATVAASGTVARSAPAPSAPGPPSRRTAARRPGASRRAPCLRHRGGTTAGSTRCPGCRAGTCGSRRPGSSTRCGRHRVCRLARHRRREHDQHDAADEAAVDAAQRAGGVEPLQYSEYRSVGRFADAATANASATRNAMFWLWATIPRRSRRCRRRPRQPRHPHFGLRRGLAALDHVGVHVVRERGRRGDRQPGHHGQDGRERHRRDEAQQDHAAELEGEQRGRGVPPPGASRIIVAARRSTRRRSPGSA